MPTVEPFRIDGLAGVLAVLQSLPKEVVSRRGGPVRAALRKAAVVIQKEVKANLAQIIATPNVPGAGDDSTGLLMANIVVTRGKPPPGENGETMRVRIRNKPYPREGKGKVVTTAQVARLLEYGTEKRAPMPFIRPAFESKKVEAVAVFEKSLLDGIDKIYKKLAAQNGQTP